MANDNYYDAYKLMRERLNESNNRIHALQKYQRDIEDIEYVLSDWGVIKRNTSERTCDTIRRMTFAEFKNSIDSQFQIFRNQIYSLKGYFRCVKNDIQYYLPCEKRLGSDGICTCPRCNLLAIHQNNIEAFDAAYPDENDPLCENTNNDEYEEDDDEDGEYDEETDDEDGGNDTSW